MIRNVQEEKWYVGYTYPRYEKKVDARIRDQDFETFLPLKEEIRQWSDRKKKVEVPLFPNYIFVRGDLHRLNALLQIEGIVRFVSFGGRYSTVTEEEIQVIRTLTRADMVVSREVPPFERGRKVEIVQGPFRGVSGELVQKGGKSRFVVQIDAIGQGISLEVPKTWVSL